MKNLIESLEEHIAAAPAPLGTTEPEKEQTASDGDEKKVEEGVSQTHITKIVEALMASPQLQKRLEAVMKRSSAGVKDEVDLDVAVSAARQSLKAHLQHSVPLALADVGADVVKAVSTKARRGAKAIAKGKSAMEALQLPDGDLGDIAEALIEENEEEQTNDEQGEGRTG